LYQIKKEMAGKQSEPGFSGSEDCERMRNQAFLAGM
jgi:hypothetical protein